MKDVEGYADLLQWIVGGTVVGLGATAKVGGGIRRRNARRREMEEERDPMVFMQRARMRKRGEKEGW